MVDKSFIVKNSLTVNSNLLFASAGQVGINNSSPDANLTLTGSANLNGNVGVSGVLSLTNVNLSFINVGGISTINSSQIALASNVILNTTSLSIGNATLNSTGFTIGNSSVNTFINSTSIVAGGIFHDITGIIVGANVNISTNSLSIGNTLVNSTINSTAFSLNGQTIISSPAFISLNPNTNIAWNMALGFNASYQINTAATILAPTNYIVGASYALAITQGNGGSHAITFSSANVLFDFGAAGTPALSITNGAIDFLFIIPYLVNATAVSIRCVFNKSALT